MTPRRKAILALGALGVVYGDIGTSPLYAFKESMLGHAGHGQMAPVADNVIGILSLLIWSLLLVISIKYVVLVMRADNKGEGGMMSLLALAVPGAGSLGRSAKRKRRGAAALVVLALLGTAFLVGEGIITPAISVLSAVEGLRVVAPGLQSYIVPITVGVLAGLFAIQSRGTGRVGFMFGPITLVWFIALAVLGIRGILLHPEVLAAFNPWYGLKFMVGHGWETAYTLGGVCLVITGGEALYADMGHFGKGPIRLAWWTVVLPALVLNYLGQGALVLHEHAVVSPLHELAPGWFRVPFLILGTMAAVIASQAMISGSFSITMQAVRMGFLPRIAIRHTSESEQGQIFVPLVNRTLMLGSIGLVLAFKTSSNLAAAYGLAVCLTMSITTVLFSHLALRRWRWPWWKVAPICGLLLLVESCFVGSNLLKLFNGGYVPMVIGVALLTTMLTWKRGRAALAEKFARICIPLGDLLNSLARGGAARVRGTAVFLTPNAGTAPPALLHNLKHNRVLHETTVILSIHNEQVPHVAERDRVEAEELGKGIWRVTAHYGFMEQPDVPAVLAACKPFGLACKLEQVSFFLGRETVVATNQRLPLWQAQYFAFLSRSSQSAMAFFRIPPNRVVELGAQIEI
jgi:KUP system potassium uptake protein